MSQRFANKKFLCSKHIRISHSVILSVLQDAPVKLCDFGFAKIDQGDLMTPQFTPYYVAPQVLEAQRRHQKEKSGIIPTSPTPYTYNKSPFS
uniref:Protein kinase domain-containing protein n=1 Tax=Astatotilapia calliptera TaxID=8154 RepID=A0AAX7UCE9_ASTCA